MSTIDPARRRLLGGLAAMPFAGAAFGVALPAAAQSQPARPPQEPPPLLRVALGSCYGQDRPAPVWDSVLAYRPQLYLALGDNVYGDVRGPELTELRQAYAEGAETYKRLRDGRIPILPIWDDHDYGLNDAGGDFPHKEGTQKLFADFWQLPADDPRRTRPGTYHAESFGPEGRKLQVILLDTRYFRSPLKIEDAPRQPGVGRYLPDDDPAKTMLGADQWAWLEDQLRQPADIRIVCSSIQVIADGHRFERWGNFPRERERLYRMVAETGAKGVVFVSGDRHLGGIYRTRAAAGYPMVELTASAINRPSLRTREKDPHVLDAVYGAENFGTIDLDWYAERLTLSLRGVNGEPVRQLALPFAELGLA